MAAENRLLSSQFKRNKRNGTYRLRKVIPYKNLELLYDIMESIPNPIYYKKESGVFAYCNTAFSGYLGVSRDKIIGHTNFDLNPKEIVQEHERQDKELKEGKAQRIFKSRVMHHDGSLHDVLINKVADMDNKGNVKGIICSMTDITELVNSERKVNRLLKLQHALSEINRIIIEKNDINEICNLVLDKVSIAMEKADIGCVLVLDKNDNLKIIASKGYDTEQCKKFSIKLQESFHYLLTQGEIDDPIIINDIQTFDWKRYTDYWKRSKNEGNKVVLINESENVDWRDYSMGLENAENIRLESSISTPILFDGQLFGFINIDSTINHAFDETDLEVMKYLKYQIEACISKYILYEQMMYLSRYDKLTNIYNRAYFEELLADTFKEACEKSEDFSLVIFDFDGLKIVNDTYGHLGGDELIKSFANQLNSMLYGRDYLGRLGGDEFAAVIYNNDKEIIIKEIERLKDGFKNNPVTYEGFKIPGSFSYGIAQFPSDGVSYNALFKKADKNMYDYKQNNKNI